MTNLDSKRCPICGSMEPHKECGVIIESPPMQPNEAHQMLKEITDGKSEN